MTAASSTERPPLYECTHDEAKEFFLRSEAYCNLPLPDYVDFTKLLVRLNKKLEPDLAPNTQIEGPCELSKWHYFPNEVRDKLQHYVIRMEKDDTLSWRPMSILHPVLYLGMVYLITNAANWHAIGNRMRKLKRKTKGVIVCASDISLTQGRATNTGAAITTWWKRFDLNVMQESLGFSHGVKTDIANCYPSIYTHAIDWALTGKKKAKRNINRNKVRIGSMIDKTLMYMNGGQTNGIPMGSVLMDFIAEILLLYIDACIAQQILKLKNREKTVKCKILRYRDDYVILANGENEAKNILHVVNEVINEFGFSLSPPKTKSSNDIIDLCSKPDRLPALQKLTTIKHSNIMLSTAKIINLQHQEYPFESAINKLLIHTEKELQEHLSMSKPKEARRYFLAADTIVPTIVVFFNIALKNPRIAPLCFSIISHLFSTHEEEKKQKLIDQMGAKVGNASHSEFFALWFLRLGHSNVRSLSGVGERPLIALHAEQTNRETLWTTDWLKDIKLDWSKKVLGKRRARELEKIIQSTTLFFDEEDYNTRPVQFSEKERTPFGDSDYE